MNGQPGLPKPHTPPSPPPYSRAPLTHFPSESHSRRQPWRGNFTLPGGVSPAGEESAPLPQRAGPRNCNLCLFPAEPAANAARPPSLPMAARALLFHSPGNCLRTDIEFVEIVIDTITCPAYIGGAPRTRSTKSRAVTCPGGGIGRRARFRSVCREAWRFESSPGHHSLSGDVHSGYPNKIILLNMPGGRPRNR